MSKNVKFNAKENTLKKDEKAFCIMFLLIIFMVLIFSYQFRVNFLGDKFGSINIIVATVLITITLFYIKNFNKLLVLYIYIINLYVIMSLFYATNDIINSISASICFIIPLFLIGLEVNEKILLKTFRYFLIVLNIIVILMFIIGILDLVFGKQIMVYISNFMSNTTRYQMILNSKSTVYRLYSFMGHPLYNTQLFIMFYILNIINNKYITKMLNRYVVIIITILGVALTGSKTGLILVATSIFFNENKKSKYKNLFIGIILLILAFKLGIFDTTISRFEGSLTTGREEKWQIVKSYNVYPLKPFYGYGVGFTFVYNNFIDWASAAFEYPFRMFSLELGIFPMILIYFCISIYPIYKLIKRKHFFILSMYFIVFIDINTYNGLSIKGDNMMIFTIFIFFILNISKNLSNKNNILIHK